MHSPTVALDRSEKVSPFFADELTYVRTALGGRLGEGGVRRPVAVITIRQRLPDVRSLASVVQ